jgi:type IV pilus assembly protein PilN
MAKINLLPWREELLKRKQKDFFNGIVLSVLVGIIIMGLLHVYFAGWEAYQEQRNQMLLNEIAELNKKILAINSIEDKKKKLLAKIDLIQKLQESRPQIVHLFDELPKVTPDGVFLTKFTQTGSELIFEGKSQSNARVSAFMRAIEASSWLQTPKLTVIQSNLQPSNKTTTEHLSDFTLRAEQEKQNSKIEEGGVNESVGN